MQSTFKGPRRVRVHAPLQALSCKLLSYVHPPAIPYPSLARLKLQHAQKENALGNLANAPSLPSCPQASQGSRLLRQAYVACVTCE